MERLLTPADVAEYLRIEETTLRDWRYRGTGPAFVRTGRSIRYRPAAVEEWIKANTETAT